MLGQKSAKSKKNKSTITNLKKGILLLNEKLYKQALIEFKVALQEMPEKALKELDQLFNEHLVSSSPQIPLTLGMAIFQVRKSDSLAIQLGNLARKTGDFKQANHLYRQALRLNNKNLLAFHNLAASMGKVGKYDHEIKAAIDKYFQFKDYLLPKPNDRNSVENLRAELVRAKLEANELKVQILNSKKVEVEASSDQEALSEIEYELDQLSNENIEIRLDDIKEHLLERLDKVHSAEEVESLYKMIFDLGLRYFKNEEILDALEMFAILKEEDAVLEDLPLCIGIGQASVGRKDDALQTLREATREEIKSRILNINLGLLHKKMGNKLLFYKYQIIAADLLEKSEGVVFFRDIVEQGDLNFKNGFFDKALKCYLIAGEEKENAKVLQKIGEVYFQMGKFTQAAESFKRILVFDPHSSLVETKLIEIHNHYRTKAEELYDERKFSQASVLFERALGYSRQLPTIDKLIATYQNLHKNKNLQELYAEREELQKIEQQKAKALKREQLVQLGRQHLKSKNFETAIDLFEEAFNIKADKDVFAYLAHIYKSLNRKRQLNSLIEHWNSVRKHEEARAKTQAFKDAQQTR